VFFDHSGIKTEINNKIGRKIPNMRKLSNTLLNNPWTKEEVSREIKSAFE
jgi:hypothetical protein